MGTTVLTVTATDKDEEEGIKKISYKIDQVCSALCGSISQCKGLPRSVQASSRR